MVIVATRDGDQIAADIWYDDELHFTPYGQEIADELDGKSAEPLTMKRKRRATVVGLPATETPVDDNPVE